MLASANTAIHLGCFTKDQWTYLEQQWNAFSFSIDSVGEKLPFPQVQEFALVSANPCQWRGWKYRSILHKISEAKETA